MHTLVFTYPGSMPRLWPRDIFELLLSEKLYKLLDGVSEPLSITVGLIARILEDPKNSSISR